MVSAVTGTLLPVASAVVRATASVLADGGALVVGAGAGDVSAWAVAGASADSDAASSAAVRTVLMRLRARAWCEGGVRNLLPMRGPPGGGWCGGRRSIVDIP